MELYKIHNILHSCSPEREAKWAEMIFLGSSFYWLGKKSINLLDSLYFSAIIILEFRLYTVRILKMF